MSSIVFILGAGASHQGGAPLMWNFLSEAKRISRNSGLASYADDFRRVFDAIDKLQIVHSKTNLDIQNVEVLFSALDMGLLLHKYPDKDRESTIATIESLKKVIAITLEQTLEFAGVPGSLSAPKPYPAFAQLLKELLDTGHRVSVITFNYDIALDYALDQESIEIDYRLGEAVRGIKVLKLHGSLNWSFRDNESKVVAWPIRLIVSKFTFPPQLPGRYKLYHHLPVTSVLPKLHSLSESYSSEPFIVPPTWNKAEHNKGLELVWAAAATELESAEFIYIIGYSLPSTDTFFHYLYALGTVGSPFERICIYNPDGKVHQRFRELQGVGSIGRFKAESSEFSIAIEEIRKELRRMS